MLSEENKRRVEQGLSLIIDDQWITIFPGDKPFKGQSVAAKKMPISKPRQKPERSLWRN